LFGIKKQKVTSGGEAMLWSENPSGRKALEKREFLYIVERSL